MVFLSLSTPEMYDIMMRGRQPDGLYDGVIAAYSAANGMKVGKVRTIFEKNIRKTVTSNDPRAGFRQIGPELERYFRRRPTVIRSPETGKPVQLMLTEPRKYLDALYTSTAMRAGFAQRFGQDGALVKQWQKDFSAEGLDPWAFSNAVRTLSDIPPSLIPGKTPIAMWMSPADPLYGTGRWLAAGQEVMKQLFLTATAPIQISEPVGFGAHGTRFGLPYQQMMKGIFEAFKNKPGQETVMESMIRHRHITQDIITATIDRSRWRSDLTNKLAGLMSRLHLNKFANEGLNEKPAALYGRQLVADMIENGRSGKDPRLTDIHFMRLLDYTPEQSMRLASGKAEDWQYVAAARRATRYMVGSTATMPQKSPLRNTRTYRFLVPFTSYFSNRFRQFDQHARLWKEAGTEFRKNPLNRAAGAKLFTASYQTAKFLVGVEMAGIVAQALYGFMREGPAGWETRFHEAKEHPMQFMWDSFIYGSFGPVYGMFYDTMLRGATSEESVEKTWYRMSRAFLPFTLITDIYSAFKGLGPYKDRDKSERFARFWKLHTPILNTLPAAWIGGMIGLNVEDPRTLAAHRAYWRYVLEDKNGVVPDFNVRGSKRDYQENFYMNMRRVKDALLKGTNPQPHLDKALAEGALRGDIANYVRTWKYLDPQSNRKITDVKRRELLAGIGPNAYKELEKWDVIFEIIAQRYDAVTPVIAERNQAINLLENQQYYATHPRPGHDD
jgi:hypothetical protein